MNFILSLSMIFNKELGRRSNMNNIVYSVNQRPPFSKILLSAFQQILAVLAATIAVPAIVQNGMSQSAALFGAGIGTLVYLLLTRFKSPVFLGSSFAFLGSMSAAFAGAASMSTSVGYFGLLLGALFAALVYAVLALLVKLLGTGWIDKVMPPVVIGPTVAIIGLTLAGNAIGDLQQGNVFITKVIDSVETKVMAVNPLIAVLVGIITLIATIVFSVYGKRTIKMIPFILGIGVGYAIAALLTLIGNTAHIDALKIIDFSGFANIKWIPDFAFIEAFKGIKDIPDAGEFFKYFGIIALAYIPVSFVVFAEHIADHKNLSSIISINLLEEPGLHRTLLGDGIGSFAGAFFGGCPNTTYGESIACVAISGNASTWVTLATALMAIAISFFGPFITFLATIPKCVMGGICMALYGFIAVSGLKMMKDVDLSDHRNLFVVSVILVTGVGQLILDFSGIRITAVACALLLGILVNFIVSFKRDKINKEANKEVKEESEE